MTRGQFSGATLGRKAAGAQKVPTAEAPARRGPGRPRKNPQDAVKAKLPSAEAPARRGPGRPRKNPPAVAVEPAPSKRKLASRATMVEGSVRGGVLHQLHAIRGELQSLGDACDEWGLDESRGSLSCAVSEIDRTLQSISGLPEDWAPPVGGVPLGPDSRVEVLPAVRIVYRRALTPAGVPLSDASIQPEARVIERLSVDEYLLAAEATGTQFVLRREQMRVLERKPMPPEGYDAPGAQLDVELEAERKKREREAAPVSDAAAVRSPGLDADVLIAEPVAIDDPEDEEAIIRRLYEEEERKVLEASKS